LLFAHDTELSLAMAVDLVNTGTDEDTLTDLAALRMLVRRHELSGVGSLEAADLLATRELRDRLRAVFTAAEPREVVTVVNKIIAGTRISPHLTDHDGYEWHVHYHAAGSPLAVHMAAECGIALATVVSAGELDRLRVCEAPDCSSVLVDLSRNRCRRYCDSRTCGNRMHVAAYRARRREAAVSS
jgi:predicted RNA-binding Zn ribbon-like protein